MNKTEKLIAKLTPALRNTILQTILRLEQNNTKGLDIKPITGRKNWYRTRVGRYRIVYIRSAEKFSLISVSKRDDQTYRDF